MKINIASFGGRSHLLDLARELESLGHEVRFYSYVPTKRATSFGLSKKASCSLYYLAFPFLILFKLFGFTRTLQYAYRVTFDRVVTVIMKPCEVFIGQAPMHYHSMIRAKKRYGAVTICESGLSNIDQYTKILFEVCNISFPKYFTNRFKKCYDCADYIAVASSFVEEGFEKHNYSKSRLFLNPYGVSVKNFKPTILSSHPYDCIVVGQWSKRKGADMVIRVCKENGFSLLHVGSIVDIEFPSDKNFTHIDAVQEYELIKYYSQAKVLLFPSYEDGFGLVLIQAAACGLPIVCSHNTGGPTLRSFITEKKWIVEMSEISDKGLLDGIRKALELSNEQIGLRDYVHDDLDKLSWEAYGKRYDHFLEEITKNISTPK